jgi:hypothetical protein
LAPDEANAKQVFFSEFIGQSLRKVLPLLQMEGSVLQFKKRHFAYLRKPDGGIQVKMPGWHGHRFGHSAARCAQDKANK